VQSLSGILSGRRGGAGAIAEIDAQVQADMVANSQVAAYRCCPKCSSERYTQRPAPPG
jgi:hypothetical protein